MGIEEKESWQIERCCWLYTEFLFKKPETNKWKEEILRSRGHFDYGGASLYLFSSQDSTVGSGWGKDSMVFSFLIFQPHSDFTTA